MNAFKNCSIVIIASATFSMQSMENNALKDAISNAFNESIERGSTENLNKLFDINNNNKNNHTIYLAKLKELATQKDIEWQQKTRKFALKATAFGALSLTYHYMVNTTMNTDDHIAFHAGTSALLVGFVANLFTNYTDPATGIIYSFIAEQSNKK
jgi:hypothetical protein